MKSFRETFKGKKVLITGNTGFKGSWLSTWLNFYDAEVYGFSDRKLNSPSFFENLNLDIDTTFSDVADLGAITKAIKHVQPDFVFHLAAQALVKDSYAKTTRTWATNTLGTVNVLEGLKKLDKKCVAIFITSDKVYDNVEWDFGYRETDRIGGPDPYSASKGGAELSIQSYFKSFFKGSNIILGIGRAGNVIGGGDWANDRIVPDLIRAWRDGKSIALRNPTSTRPWQHVLEPLSGYMNLACVLYETSLMEGEAFNFGPNTNKNRTVEELIIESKKWVSEIDFIDLSTSDNLYESKLLKLNIDKATEKLGWEAIWDFEETIEKTILWYKEFYEKKDIQNFSIGQIKSYIEQAKYSRVRWATLD